MFRTDHLPGALPDEKLIGIYRRHPITIFGLLLGLCVLLALPLLAYAGLRIFHQDYLADQQLMAVIVMFGGLFLLYVFMFIYQNFLDYWLDMWIVTSRRIINIEQRGLFARTTSELRLYRVQDVTSEVNGFVRSMMDFGMVYVQTAGEKEYFTFEDVPHPNQIAKDILALAESDRKDHLEEAMEAMEETTVEHHDKIRQDAAMHLEP